MNLKTRFWAGLAVVLLAFGSLMATVTWSAIAARHRAEQLLGDVRSLNVSSATLKDVKRLTEGYPVEEVYYASLCTEDSCQVTISIENSWLHQLRLAPETRFEAFFNIERRRLRYFTVGFAKSRPPFFPLHVRAWEVIPEDGERRETTFIESCEGNGSLKLATAYILPSASPEEQEKAFTFNLDCLTRIGGCEDHDFMPRLCVRPER